MAYVEQLTLACVLVFVWWFGISDSYLLLDGTGHSIPRLVSLQPPQTYTTTTVYNPKTLLGLGLTAAHCSYSGRLLLRPVGVFSVNLFFRWRVRYYRGGLGVDSSDAAWRLLNNFIVPEQTGGRWRCLTNHLNSFTVPQDDGVPTTNMEYQPWLRTFLPPTFSRPSSMQPTCPNFW